MRCGTYMLGPRPLRPIGARPFIDSGAWLSLGNHVQRYALPITPFSFEDFSVYATRAPRSAPGPDGVPYACWAYSGDGGLRLLHQVYSAVVRGDPAPPSFNQAWMVLIPKAPIALDAAHVARPANLRSFTLSNSCQNIVAKALCAPLEDVARSVVHDAQRGFVRGRQMATNLVGADAAIENFVHDPGSDPGLILLDIQAAFPSIDWDWVQWVLRQMGIPDWLVDAIFSTYHGSEVEILLHGQRSGSDSESREASSRGAQRRVVSGHWPMTR